jgi:hypothetical protein
VERPLRLLAELAREWVGRFLRADAIQGREGGGRVTGVEKSPSVGQGARPPRRRRRLGRGGAAARRRRSRQAEQEPIPAREHAGAKDDEPDRRGRRECAT